MKSEDFVSKFDLDGLLEYAKSLNLPKFDYSFEELKIEIRYYASLYRSSLEVKRD